MNKNVLFLDFDGVVNILDINAKTQPENSTTTLKGFPIAWNPEVVDTINTINMLENVDVVWLTDWQDVPGGFEDMKSLLDLGPFDETETPLPVYSVSGWWKFPARKKFIEIHNLERSVWIDDNCPHSPEEPHKMEHVNPLTGITVARLEEIALYLSEGIDYHKDSE